MSLHKGDEMTTDDISAPMAAVRTQVQIAADHRDYHGWLTCNGCTTHMATVEQAIRISNAQAVVSALEQTLARSDGCEGGQVASALAAWKAEVARLQADA